MILAPPSDVVFRAVGFFSGISVELRVGNCALKFQPPILFGGRTEWSQIWSKSRFRTFRSSRDKLRTHYTDCISTGSFYVPLSRVWVSAICLPKGAVSPPPLCEKFWELKFFRFSRFAPILALPSDVIFIVVRFFF